MLAYYIDEALSESEAGGVLEQLEEFGEDVASGLTFMQIPVEYETLSNDDLIEACAVYLRDAGISPEARFLFIMPRDEERWGTILHTAFKECERPFPYIAHPWEQDGYDDDAPIVRRISIPVMDLRVAMSFL